MSVLEKLTSTWATESKVRLMYEHTTTSTFESAKHNFLIDQDTSVTLYTAGQQTEGRGRGERTWENTESGSFLSTWSFKVGQPPQPITVPLVGLAVYKSILEAWPMARASLKAPNDILLDGKKVAGLLIENIQQGSALRSLVGVGINVLDHPEVHTEATSLAEHLQGDLLLETSWAPFLNSLKWNLEQALVDGALQFLSTGLREQIKEALNKNPRL